MARQVQCPACGSYGVEPLRRRFLRKLLRRAHIHYCRDCGERFMRHQR